MSAAFKVGDLLIGQCHVIDTQYNGMECEVTGPLAMRGQEPPIFPCLQYRVKWADGSETSTRPYLLRKKHPPRSAKSIMREAILKAKEPVRELA